MPFGRSLPKFRVSEDYPLPPVADSATAGTVSAAPPSSMAQAPAPVEHGPTPLDQGDVDFNFDPPPSRKFTLYHQFLNVSDFKLRLSRSCLRVQPARRSGGHRLPHGSG